MSVVQLDLQKIEQLLNSATSQRQRKMYQALLDKAQSQLENSTESSAPLATPEPEKKAQTKTKGQTETKTKAKTTNKQKKATRKSATIKAEPATQSTTPVTEFTQLTQVESVHQTKTEPLPEKQPKQQPDSESPIFQALGTILATPYLQGELLKVTIDGREYDLLYATGFQRRYHRSLKSELEENGSKEMFLKLYPVATFSGSDQKPRLSFSLANFRLNGEQLNNYPQEFVLRGIWQYITHCDSPVISIYRNRDQLPTFKKLNAKQQFHFAKPHHIPVVWSATVEPFKFNPQAEKGSQMPRYFVEVRATFKDGLYVVEEMLREPTRNIPRFIKVSKSSATTG